LLGIIICIKLIVNFFCRCFASGFATPGIMSGPASSFSSLQFCFFQLFQFFLNVLAESDLAFQDAAGPAGNAIRIQLHAVLIIEIEVFTGKSHGEAVHACLRLNSLKFSSAIYFMSAGTVMSFVLCKLLHSFWGLPEEDRC